MQKRGSSENTASWDEISDLASIVVEADFSPTPFEFIVSLSGTQFVHQAVNLRGLVDGHAEFRLEYVAVAGIELLHALLDEVWLGALLGDRDAGPVAAVTRSESILMINLEDSPGFKVGNGKFEVASTWRWWRWWETVLPGLVHGRWAWVGRWPRRDC